MIRPVIEKRKFSIRHVFYLIIFAICVISIGIAIYMQFYRDAKLDVIFGIVKEDKDEIEISELKANFLNNFNNNTSIIESSNVKVQKIREDADIIMQGYDLEETTDSYTVNVKIPYFNIDADLPKAYNQEIRNNFRNKADSVISNTNQDDYLLVYNVRYKVYMFKDIVSLVIISELKEGGNSERIILKTYNYNLKEEREVGIQELLKIRGASTREVTNRIKNEVDKAQEQNIRLKEAGYDVEVRDTSSDTYKAENAKYYFIGERGYIYIVYPYGNSEYTSQMDIIIIK